MTRPKGSLNKATIERINANKPKAGVYTIELEKQIEGSAICKENMANSIINWGKKNDYPYRLIDLYNTSITHKACIDFSTNVIVGDGLDYEAMGVTSEELGSPNYQMSWLQFIKALSFDYSLYGGFAFQIIRSRGGNQYFYYPQPLETIRLEKADEEGVIKFAKISADWSDINSNPPVELPIFGFQEGESIAIGKPYLFYYKDYNPVQFYYPLPKYSAGIPAIQTEAEFEEFDKANIMNGFCAQGILQLPPVETEQEKQAMIDNIQRMFQGSKNNNSMMITFGDGTGESVVNYTPFNNASNSSVDLYKESNERCVNRICAAHGVVNKGLIGYPVDNTGFSDSGAYLQASYKLYNVNVGNTNRRTIVNAINSAFALNGIELELRLKPLNYMLDDDSKASNEPQNEDKQTDKTGGEETTEDNAVERTKGTDNATE